jgi:hypothetical protein
MHSRYDFSPATPISSRFPSIVIGQILRTGDIEGIKISFLKDLDMEILGDIRR